MQFSEVFRELGHVFQNFYQLVKTNNGLTLENNLISLDKRKKTSLDDWISKHFDNDFYNSEFHHEALASNETQSNRNLDYQKPVESNHIDDILAKKALIFDDFISKSAAWQAAVHVVCLLMRTDSEVITGNDDEKWDF